MAQKSKHFLKHTSSNTISLPYPSYPGKSTHTKHPHKKPPPAINKNLKDNPNPNTNTTQTHPKEDSLFDFKIGQPVQNKFQNRNLNKTVDKLSDYQLLQLQNQSHNLNRVQSENPYISIKKPLDFDPSATFNLGSNRNTTKSANAYGEMGPNFNNLDKNLNVPNLTPTDPHQNPTYDAYNLAAMAETAAAAATLANPNYNSPSSIKMLTENIEKFNDTSSEIKHQFEKKKKIFMLIAILIFLLGLGAGALLYFIVAAGSTSNRNNNNFYGINNLVNENIDADERNIINSRENKFLNSLLDADNNLLNLEELNVLSVSNNLCSKLTCYTSPFYPNSNQWASTYNYTWKSSLWKIDNSEDSQNSKQLELKIFRNELDKTKKFTENYHILTYASKSSEMKRQSTDYNAEISEMRNSNINTPENVDNEENLSDENSNDSRLSNSNTKPIIRWFCETHQYKSEIESDRDFDDSQDSLVSEIGNSLTNKNNNNNTPNIGEWSLF